MWLVRTQCFHCSSPGSIPDARSKIFQAARPGQENKIRNDCVGITPELTEIKIIVWGCYAKLHMNIFDNSEDTDNFLEILPPKLNHEAIENLNRRETNKKIKSVIQKLQQRTTLWSFSLLNSTKHKY